MSVIAAYYKMACSGSGMAIWCMSWFAAGDLFHCLGESYVAPKGPVMLQKRNYFTDKMKKFCQKRLSTKKALAKIWTAPC